MCSYRKKKCIVFCHRDGPGGNDRRDGSGPALARLRPVMCQYRPGSHSYRGRFLQRLGGRFLQCLRDILMRRARGSFKEQSIRACFIHGIDNKIIVTRMRSLGRLCFFSVSRNYFRPRKALKVIGGWEQRIVSMEVYERCRKVSGAVTHRRSVGALYLCFFTSKNKHCQRCRYSITGILWSIAGQ